MAKNSAGCAELPVGLKFHFSKWETNFSEFIVIRSLNLRRWNI